MYLNINTVYTAADLSAFQNNFALHNIISKRTIENKRECKILWHCCCTAVSLYFIEKSEENCIIPTLIYSLSSYLWS